MAVGVALFACGGSLQNDRAADGGPDGGSVAASIGARGDPGAGIGAGAGGASDAGGGTTSSPVSSSGISDNQGVPVKILCNNSADCSNGQVCCGPITAGSIGSVVACFPSCPGACDALEQCSSTSDCPAGETCENTGAGASFCFPSSDAGTPSEAGTSIVDAGPYSSCFTSGAGRSDCGAASESCCTSLEVSGGTFFRTYDPLDADGGVLAPDGGPTGLADPATVSSFLLDKYPVTVARFRQFVQAWDGGWRPPAASGKHTHLNGGDGLNAAGGGYEPGWAPADDAQVTPTDDDLRSCCPYSTWTPSPGANESRPIDCVNWYESYAFCIWDGAFLPSDAEFGYAAAGGAEQREYPWGSTDPGTANQYAIYGTDQGPNLGCYYPTLGQCVGAANIAPVGTPTLGAARWGQLDMTGNVYQWTLDTYGPLANPCTDCADVETYAHGVAHGAQLWDLKSALHASNRSGTFYGKSYPLMGMRCARAP